MSEQTVVVIGKGDTRLDILLGEACDVTRSQLARLIESGHVTVNGKTISKAGMKPAAGAAVRLSIPPVRQCLVEKEDIPLDILYQDSDLAVVVKPQGMVVHPAAGNENHTLVNALLFHLTDLSGVGGEARPGIVHRLDKDTSGLLLIAKNDASHVNLSAQLKNHEMEKHYRAVVEGVMKAETGFIDAPIARHITDRKRMAINAAGRASRTEWRLIENMTKAAYLDVHLITGRTHQIRVHMASIHHPVAGDVIYGFKKGLPVKRLMLHAYSLSFTHPVTQERMTFTAPLPEDFQKSLDALRR